MKCIALKVALLVVLASSIAFAGPHASTHTTDKKWLKLPSLLGLSASQKIQFQRYWNDMHRDLVKIHDEASEKLKKVLSPEQLKQLVENIHKTSPPKNDEQIKSIVTKQADLLLLTTNQEAELQRIALTYHHKSWEIKNTFYLRLSKVLTQKQQEQLAKIRATW